MERAEGTEGDAELSRSEKHTDREGQPKQQRGNATERLRERKTEKDNTENNNHATEKQNGKTTSKNSNISRAIGNSYAHRKKSRENANHDHARKEQKSTTKTPIITWQQGNTLIGKI